jgi:hypothetical protein
MVIRKQMLENKAEVHYAILASQTELATMVNAMEDAALGYIAGSDVQLEVDALVLEITKVTGY